MVSRYGTPDFAGSFDQPMSQLRDILSDNSSWTLIGSSYGWLMATVFALDHEAQLRKLTLLAPALTLEPFDSLSKPGPVSVSMIVIHGRLDTVVPLEPVRDIAQKLFTNLAYYIVEDDHRPRKTANEMDWKSILS
jgi:pimeloyl-ACP methyl ester carboxylesterase